MSVHGDGSGVSWIETLDVDQPQGLDYRQFNHVTIGVRKRLAKEHISFDDETVGGDHVPGKCQVLAFVDGTSDVTSPFSDGSFFGHGIVWDTSSRLWCITCDATYVNQTPKVVKLNPNDQWEGGDITWAGNHQFDNTVFFKDNLDISGDVLLDGSLVVLKPSEFTGAVFDSSVDITRQLWCYSSAYFANDVSMKADLVVDGTAVFTTNVDVSGTLDVSGNVSISGTLTNARVPNTYGKVDVTTNNVIAGNNIAGVDFSSAGHYCVSFTGALSNDDYIVSITPQSTGSDNGIATARTVYDPSTKGFHVVQVNTNSGAAVDDVSIWHIIVLGA